MVHANDEQAKTFYERYGFEPFGADPFTMFLLMKDIKTSLGVAGQKQ